MAHLIETYSRASGLRISDMPIDTLFFPLKCEGKYIVVVSSTGMPAKNYSYFGATLSFAREALHRDGYTIVQAGGAKDERVGADIDICGQTSIKQFSYIVKHAALIICGDTSALHIAGACNVPVISLFGITHPKVSGAYFGDADKQIYLTPSESWRPSYNPNESPRLIDNIKPESVLAAIDKLLGVSTPRIETNYIGKNAKKFVLEVVPNMILGNDIQAGVSVQVRLDKGGNPETAVQQFTVRKGILVTNQPVPIDALRAVRANLEAVVYVIEKDTHNPKFAQDLRSSGIPFKLASFLSPADLLPLKLDYADVGVINRETQPTKETLDVGVARATHFKTGRRIFSKGKCFLTYEHEKQNISLDNLAQSEDTILDTPEFWSGAEFTHLYNYV